MCSACMCDTTIAVPNAICELDPNYKHVLGAL